MIKIKIMIGEAPPALTNTKEIISESFEITQNGIHYKLNIDIIGKDIKINLSKEEELLRDYEITFNFEELKNLNQIFSLFRNCQDFINYLRILIQKQKLLILHTKENRIIIEIIAEYLYNQNNIKFELIQKNINLDLIDRDLYKKISSLNEKYKKILDENKKIKEQNRNLWAFFILYISISIFVIYNLKNNGTRKKVKLNSTIIESEIEIIMIIEEIEKRMNKTIKGTNLLYQATTDGGRAVIFHKKCDNIPNTLILYKSNGNRRFGGFASKSWDQYGGFIDDEKSFLFSLDRKRVYPPKNGNFFQIYSNSNAGPSFYYRSQVCIRLFDTKFKNNVLKTYGKSLKYLFNGFSKELSEYSEYNSYNSYYNKNGKNKQNQNRSIYVKEYEVFEIKF